MVWLTVISTHLANTWHIVANRQIFLLANSCDSACLSSSMSSPRNFIEKAPTFFAKIASALYLDVGAPGIVDDPLGGQGWAAADVLDHNGWLQAEYADLSDRLFLLLFILFFTFFN